MKHLIIVLAMFFCAQTYGQIGATLRTDRLDTIVCESDTCVNDSSLLDFYPNAEFAISLRRVDIDYNGYCMQVVGLPSGRVKEIDFVCGFVDTACIKQFANEGSYSDSVYVNVWYDQSGNGGDIVSTGTRGYVYKNGALVTNPAGKFAAEWKAYDYPDSIYIPSHATILSGAMHSVFDDPGYYFNETGCNQVVDNYCYLVKTGGQATKVVRFFTENNGNTKFADLEPTDIMDEHVLFVDVTDSTTISFRSTNGEDEATSDTYLDISICPTGVSGATNTYMYELAIWNEDYYSDKAGIQSNLNSYFGIY